ncbi:MAG: shikimate kinase [Bacillota bacterium]
MYGLIGEKLGHSFSKVVHEEFQEYSYDLYPLSREEFPKFMEKKEFTAINVTIPYKEMVMPYLDHIDDKAKSIGAVNTIVNRDGMLTGFNTDYDGFLYTLEVHNIEVKGKKTLILGKGGAAKACSAVLSDLGAEVYFVYYKQEEGFLTYETCYTSHTDAEIIVNTTPVGMHPNDQNSPIQLSFFPNLRTVIDVVYNPLRTKLLIEAEELGITAIGGLEMLIAQAKFAAEIFMKKKLGEDTLDALYKKIRREKNNIVLVGMSGSGKSVLGKKIADQLGKKFVDTDAEIVKQIGMPIHQFFRENGEAPFRLVESEVVAQLSGETGLVIATGGGVIKDHNNVRELKKNGVIVWLHRNPELLAYGTSRPLASTKEETKKLYDERFPLYERAADFTVSNDETEEMCVASLMEKFMNY